MSYDTRFYGLDFSYDDFNGMPYVPLGGSGLKVSRMGLGTWKIGYPERGDGSRLGRDAAFRLFDRAVELGVTFWDTANRYNESSGNSERVMGEWFRVHPDQRRNIVVATKLAGAMDGTTPNHCGLSRANILDSVYASLERLQIDHIDLLQFHRPDASVPVAESLEAVADLRQRDLVRYLGLSGAGVAELEEYARVAQALHLPAVSSVQNQFNPLDGAQEREGDVLPWCAAHDVCLIPFGPLKRGLLTNRYLRGQPVGPGDRLVDEGELEQVVDDEIYATLDRLAHLAAQGGLTVAQLSLAYLLQLPGMGPQIPSASTVAQLEENAAAATVELPEEVLSELHEVFVS